MLAAAIRIYAEGEGHIGTVIAGKDRTRRVYVVLCLNPAQLIQFLFIRQIVDSQLFESIPGIECGAAPLDFLSHWINISLPTRSCEQAFPSVMKDRQSPG